MSGSARFNAIVGIRDETAAPLRAIGARFAAIAQQTGISRLAGSLAAVGQAMAGLAASAGRVAAPMATIGGVAAAAGMIRFATGAAAAGDDLSDLSEATGVSIRDLQAWGDAAQRAGADQQTLAGSLQRLNRGMREAATGGNAELAQMFRLLGIPLRDAQGQIRSASDVLPDLAEAFKVNEDPTLRTTMAIAAFGRAGTALIPMLAAGRRELREQGERWRRYGFDFTNVARQMAVAQNQFDNFAAAMRGLGDAIGARLAPVLGPLAQQTADWVAANRDLIALSVGEWAERVGAALRDFFAERGPLERIEAFSNSVRSTVEALGGWSKIMIGFGALAAAPFVAALVTIVGAAAPLLKALGSLALAMGAGSPIGVALLALAGAGYLIYRNWDELSDFFSGFWSNLVTGMAPQIDMLRQFVEAVGEPLVAPLRAAWSGLSSFFDGVWSGITNAFTTAWEKIRPIADLLAGVASRITAGGSPTGPVNSPAAQALRSSNMQRGGASFIEGFLAPPLASPASRNGEVEMVVRFENAPPGTRVETVTRGPMVGDVRTDVGYSMPPAR